jgi:hypothetical protein
MSDRNETYWLGRDHEEAIAIDRQLAAAGPGVTPQHVIDLNRFCDCAEDSEGYDVPKERMRKLRDAGLVSGGSFGYYTTTEHGMRVRFAWFEQQEPTHG